MRTNNGYAELIGKWKVDLILERARRKGFRSHELDDVLQELVLIVRDFQYDPTLAAERTALTTVIDRRLVDMLRSRSIHQRHLELAGRERGLRDGEEPVDQSASEDNVFADDLRNVLKAFPEYERSICHRLAAGEAKFRVAEQLGISRYEMDRVMDRIRAGFIARGITECAVA